MRRREVEVGERRRRWWRRQRGTPSTPSDDPSAVHPCPPPYTSQHGLSESAPHTGSERTRRQRERERKRGRGRERERELTLLIAVQDPVAVVQLTVAQPAAPLFHSGPRIAQRTHSTNGSFNGPRTQECSPPQSATGSSWSCHALAQHRTSCSRCLGSQARAPGCSVLRLCSSIRSRAVPRPWGSLQTSSASPCSRHRSCFPSARGTGPA
eukprot:2223345-Rhodomonas_salina.2